MKDYWQPLPATQYNLTYTLSHSPRHRGLNRHTNKKESLFSETQAINKLNRTLDILETYAMPGKAKRAQFNSGEIKFAKCKLSDEQHDEFISWKQDQSAKVWEMLHELAEHGWKASFGEDMTNACYIASHTCNNEDDRNYKICVSSRSDDIEEALMMNCYKIGVLFADKKLPTEAQGNSWG